MTPAGPRFANPYADLLAAAPEGGLRCELAVIGCGNLLRADDGAGPVLIRELWEGGVPPGVRLVDGGTAGMDVAFQMRGAARVIIVDAASTGARPGTVFKIPRTGGRGAANAGRPAHALFPLGSCPGLRPLAARRRLPGRCHRLPDRGGGLHPRGRGEPAGARGHEPGARADQGRAPLSGDGQVKALMSNERALRVETEIVPERGQWAVDIVVLFADGAVRHRIATYRTETLAKISASSIKRAAERDIPGPLYGA